MTEVSASRGLRVRAATEEDAAAVAAIYNQGIEDRIATFETEPRSAEDRRAWLLSLAGRYPMLVADAEGQVVGWAGAGPTARGSATVASVSSRSTSGAIGGV